jgi:hypothetical protein
MPLRPLIVACAAFAVLMVSPGAANSAPEESWADSQFGWTTKATRQSCKPFKDVCSTEDGGATWHGIFNGGTFVFGVVRTSATAGLVSTGRQESAQFWTRDNGRHWYQTKAIRGDFRGSGKYLFWIDNKNDLYQVRPWPPRGRAVCKGVWATSAFSTRPERRGNICNGALVEAGMRADIVATLEQGEGTFGGISTIPGGVIATIASPAGPTKPRVLLHRVGRNRLVDLPQAEEMVPCAGMFNTEPIVTWPRITVLGCSGAAGAGSGSWTSLDGGQSWIAT